MKTIVLKSNCNDYFYKIHYIDKEGELYDVFSLDDLLIDDISDSEIPSYDEDDYVLEYHDGKWIEQKSEEEFSIFITKKALKEIAKTVKIDPKIDSLINMI